MDKSLEEIFHIKREVRILVIIFISILLIGTIGFTLIKNVSLYEGSILTLETLSFLHKEESGLAKSLQIFLLFIGVVLIWFIMWTTLDLALEGHFQKYYFGVRNMDKIKKLNNHYIVCGAGRVGENIAKMLKQQKRDYVLLEKNSEIAKELFWSQKLPMATETEKKLKRPWMLDSRRFLRRPNAMVAMPYSPYLWSTADRTSLQNSSGSASRFL